MKSFEETFGGDIKACAESSPAKKEILEKQFPLLFKKAVTRKWIKQKAEYLVERFDGECSLTTLQCIGIMTVLTEKGDLEDLLSEFDIEVKE